MNSILNNIILATYGTSHQQIKVTDKFKSMLQESDSFQINNNNFWDCHKGFRKRLTLRFQDNDNIMVFNEDENFNLDTYNTYIKQKKKYYFSVYSVFKNEAHILKEWVEHYLQHGAEQIYLINDHSTDNFQEILQPFIIDAKVTLFNSDVVFENQGRQVKIYEKYWPTITQDSEWVALLDLDEFLYSPVCVDIREIIRDNDNQNTNQILVDWVNFGSSNHVHQPISVVEGFQQRVSHDQAKELQQYSYKSIVKTSKTLNVGIHGSNVEGSTKCLGWSHNNSTLLINHYIIQSLNYFTQIKATRGDADRWLTTEARNLEFFKNHDYNEEFDNRLYLQNKNKIQEMKQQIASTYCKNEDVTLIFISSYNRLIGLKKTWDSFLQFNTYRHIKEVFVLIEEVVGEISSENSKTLKALEIAMRPVPIFFVNEYSKKNRVCNIDRIYSYVRSQYIFRCDEDYKFFNKGFLEKSLSILQQDPKIYTIWLDNMPPTEEKNHKYEYINNYVENQSLPGLFKTTTCWLVHPYELTKRRMIDCKNSIDVMYENLGYYSTILPIVVSIEN